MDKAFDFELSDFEVSDHELFNTHNNSTRKVEVDFDISLNELDLSPKNTLEFNKHDNKLDVESVESSDTCNTNNNINYTQDRIVINVGGKKFDIRSSLLKSLNIKQQELFAQDNSNIYFLDRDPVYFQEIVKLIKSNNIENTLPTLSSQIVGEICNYSILYKAKKPPAKIKTASGVIFKNKYTNFVKIYVQDQVFETLRSTLARSEYLKNIENKSTITDIDPKIFRYVLNLLRNNELYIYNTEIIEALEKFGIEFTCSEKNYDTNFVSFYKQLDLADNPDKYMFQYMNNISANSLLKFDTTLKFNIPQNKDSACISAISIYFDLPKLNRLKNEKYYPNVGYNLIDHIYIKKDNRIIYQATGSQLYLMQQLLTCNESYNKIVNNNETYHLVFNNETININRVIVPLFLVSEKYYVAFNDKTKLPIEIFLKVSPLSQVASCNNIDLLNVGLICNYTSTISYPEKYPDIICSTHRIQVNNSIRIKVDQYKKINDFYFTFSSKYNTRVDNIIANNLICLKIYKTINNKENLMIELDSLMLNMYFPLNYLGKVLQNGVYYCSFDIATLKTGFCGENYIFEFFIKNDAILNLYINNYIF